MKKYYKRNQKIISNINWLLFDKIFRMGSGVVISIWMARVLGPEQFGIMNFSIAFVGLFLPVVTLGLNGTIPRDLILSKHSDSEILGTAFVITIFSGAIAVLFSVASVMIIKDSDVVVGCTAILSGALLFKSADIVRYYYESKVESKFVVLLENMVFCIFAIAKVWFIFKEYSVYYFCWLTLFEAVFVSLGLLILYQVREDRVRSWVFSSYLMKQMLSDSWPIILSGLAVTMYMRIDQVMISSILGDEDVGIFSAAVRLSEIWYFLPVIIASSIYPHLTKIKNSDEKNYYKSLQLMLSGLGAVSILSILITTLSADFVILTFYGPAFKDASEILVVQIWSGLFVFQGVASSRWFINENLQKLTLYRSLVGATVNVALNFLLIPRLGLAGAAYSTVISQALSSVLLNAFSQKTRKLFYMQFKAMLGIDFIAYVFLKFKRALE